MAKSPLQTDKNSLVTMMIILKSHYTGTHTFVFCAVFLVISRCIQGTRHSQKVHNLFAYPLHYSEMMMLRMRFVQTSAPFEMYTALTLMAKPKLEPEPVFKEPKVYTCM